MGLAVAGFSIEHFPQLAEGELAKLRAAVVSSVALGEVALELEVGSALRLGKGESNSGGAQKQSILADAFEAIIGAVFLDAGWHVASEVALRHLGERARVAAVGPGGHDFKTRLQELVARRFSISPRYAVESSGPDHRKTFTAQVLIDGDVCGSGEGGSKKEAEQAAAAQAWHQLSETESV